MRQAGRRPRLAQEADPRLFALPLGKSVEAGERLHRHFASQRGVARQENLAHGAPTERAEHLVPTKCADFAFGSHRAAL